MVDGVKYIVVTPLRCPECGAPPTLELMAPSTGDRRVRRDWCRSPDAHELTIVSLADGTVVALFGHHADQDAQRMARIARAQT